MWGWVVDNKTWLFSGLLVAAPVAIVTWLVARKSVVQKQKSGNNSVNIQATGDVDLGKTSPNPPDVHHD